MLSRVDILVSMTSCVILKGTATLMISMCYQKELYEPRILIQVSSKSVENGQVLYWLFKEFNMANM